MFTKLEPVTPGATADKSGCCWSISALTSLLRWLLAVMLLVTAPFALAAPTTPTEDFTDNLDGTVTHRITGLTWMRCAMGMTWTGTTCSGTASTYTWDQATKLTANFAGKSDWRLPSIAELNTIVERDSYQPAINSTIFFDSVRYYQDTWTGSSNVSDPRETWFVDFENGRSYPYPEITPHAVRLVRSDQAFDSLMPYTPTADFLDNNDGTVTHLNTGLMWKRCAEGQFWSGGSSWTGTGMEYDW